MSKVDLIFVILGIFSYISIMIQFREQDYRVLQYETMIKKKKLYEEHVKLQKHREAMKKAAEERKAKRKMDFDSMAGTVEMLSSLSDQEVMRKSRVTSGKF